jgi:hypothetical protein
VTTDNTAIIAALLNGCANLHNRVSPVVCWDALLVTVEDAPAREVVDVEFQQHSITGQNLDEVLPHPTRNMSQDLVSIIQLNTKHRIGQGFRYSTFDFNAFIFRHNTFNVAATSQKLVIKSSGCAKGITLSPLKQLRN